MKKILVSTIFVFVAFGIKAQSKIEKKADSLLMLYSKTEEISAKVEVLEDLIENYFYTNADKSKKYIDELLKISDSLEYAEGKILGNLNLGYYYYTIEKMDSAELLPEQHTEIG